MERHVVRIGDIVVGKAPDVLEALALGSCVSAVIYDPVTKIGVMTHVLLPASRPYKEIDTIGKYADKAIPEAIRKVVAKGAKRDRLQAKIAGGAKMFEMSSGNNKLSVDIGARNIEAVKAQLKNSNITIVAEDTGDTFGRTVSFDLSNNIFSIKLGLQKIVRRI